MVFFCGLKSGLQYSPFLRSQGLRPALQYSSFLRNYKNHDCICLLLRTSAVGLRTSYLGFTPCATIFIVPTELQKPRLYLPFTSYPGLAPRAIVLRPFRTKKTLLNWLFCLLLRTSYPGLKSWAIRSSFLRN